MPRRKHKRNKRVSHKKCKKTQSNHNSVVINVNLKQMISVLINAINEKNVLDNNLYSEMLLHANHFRVAEYCKQTITEELLRLKTNPNPVKIDFFIDIIVNVLKKYRNNPNCEQMIYNSFEELFNLALTDKFATFIKDIAEWCVDLFSSMPKSYGGKDIFETIFIKKNNEYFSRKELPSKTEFFRYLSFVGQLLNIDAINNTIMCDTLNLLIKTNDICNIEEMCIILNICGKKLDNDNKSKQILDKWFNKTNLTSKIPISCICKSNLLKQIHDLRQNEWKKTKIIDCISENEYFKIIFGQNIKECKVKINHEDIMRQTAHFPFNKHPPFIKNNNIILFKHTKVSVYRFIKDKNGWLITSNKPLILSYDFYSKSLEIISLIEPLKYNKIKKRINEQICTYNESCGCVQIGKDIQIKCFNDACATEQFMEIWNSYMEKNSQYKDTLKILNEEIKVKNDETDQKETDSESIQSYNELKIQQETVKKIRAELVEKSLLLESVHEKYHNLLLKQKKVSEHKINELQIKCKQLQMKYDTKKITETQSLISQITQMKLQYNNLGVEYSKNKAELQAKCNDFNRLDVLQKELENSLTNSKCKQEKIKEKFDKLQMKHNNTIAEQKVMHIEMDKLQRKYDKMENVLIPIGKLIRDNNIGEENNEEAKCVVCLDGESDHIIIPCGHVCICIECKKSYNNNSTCPICRAKVTNVIKTFN